jgi:putative transposase
MIDRTHPLPIERPGQLLQLARLTVYYQPSPGSDPTLALMRRINAWHVQYSFEGARTLREWLQEDGHAIGRRHGSP